MPHRKHVTCGYVGEWKKLTETLTVKSGRVQVNSIVCPGCGKKLTMSKLKVFTHAEIADVA